MVNGVEADVVERAAGVGGELVLRRAGEHHEIISNGVFLMDTRNGESERLLVTAAVAAVDGGEDRGEDGGGDGRGGGVSVLVGGLGVGFSLAEAVRLPRVGAVTVVEREPAVVAWHDGPDAPLRPFSQGAVDDPRVRIVTADLVDHLASDASRYDVLCLDVDNGPDWTVTPGNARLYGPDGLDLLAARLSDRGVLAVWSAGAAPAFEDLLRSRFERVEVLPVPVPRGEPDVVYLAHRA
ncbi:spermidine synthase [Actinomadura rupiterrae]|uniref:spermidine synthase n=1 Tax=Actinomadura rupiterrae TaxID=559627 RepID=UPI0020A29FEF|nr:spermidine synthase [Actinomadura rupiterrae]MCP2343075.1 putative membrane-bound spermidine synthase [Actinomadura rupiterrae]